MGANFGRLMFSYISLFFRPRGSDARAWIDIAIEMVFAHISDAIAIAIPATFVNFASKCYALVDNDQIHTELSVADVASLNGKLSGIEHVCADKRELQEFLLLRSKYALTMLVEIRQILSTAT